MRGTKEHRGLLRHALPALVGLVLCGGLARAEVKPGDVITPQNASKVQGLLSPGNYILVQDGMVLNIVPSGRIEWPPPYAEATEKYHAQVCLKADGSILNYVATELRGDDRQFPCLCLELREAKAV